MRLNSVDRTRILAAAAEQFGPDVAVLLFGSRVDDTKRGGDIDLLVCPAIAETLSGFPLWRGRPLRP